MSESTLVGWRYWKAGRARCERLLTGWSLVESGPGSHRQFRPLIHHAFFASLSNRLTWFDTSVPEMSLRIARRAARFRSRVSM